MPARNVYLTDEEYAEAMKTSEDNNLAIKDVYRIALKYGLKYFSKAIKET